MPAGFFLGEIFMRVALHDHEQNGYPNLALMKLSAWHKSQGDDVQPYMELMQNSYDKVYSSKIFTWTALDKSLPSAAEIGGTGYDIKKVLPREIEFICPDYDFYNCKKSYGFLTRGCPNKCSWCFVPEKEGDIKSNQNIEDFLRHDEVVLMDNNVLAHEHGIKQIEKLIKLGVKVDFNQGLDARLIDNSIAKLLGKIRWSPTIRLACDTMAQMEPIRKAVELLRWHNATPRSYFVYVLVKDVTDALERIRFLKGLSLDPFCQPYRDKQGTPPTSEQKKFSRYVNHKAIFKSITWEEYDH
jgi:hypothetical protein